eukprot:CAMPEP_0119124260 /NCGR_PEP_ID=MMETSP1310-20130426/3939_1 /TAXON_ID=464262 /ORGANISM="Genus nov. species nov., Strain RCC2339" /LENGTH=96 /DNA_ID=CAMNT_0007114185 /DNA_START=42 /DNA_END=329 /DNA_ORIENTATION=-
MSDGVVEEPLQKVSHLDADLKKRLLDISAALVRREREQAAAREGTQKPGDAGKKQEGDDAVQDDDYYRDLYARRVFDKQKQRELDLERNEHRRQEL